MNPADSSLPRRRWSDEWTSESIGVKFGAIDDQMTALNPLPTVVAKIETRMENLVTKEDLHNELGHISEQMSANRRTIIVAACSIVAALIAAVATVVAAAI